MKLKLCFQYLRYDQLLVYLDSCRCTYRAYRPRFQFRR